MRERDMRARVEQFIQTRLRRMIAPATLGLGLAGLGLTTTGCPSSGLDANEDGGAVVNDAGPDQGAALKYMAPMPDAGAEVALPHPEYIAPIPADGGMKLDVLGTPIYSAPAPDGGPVMRYMAQMPDSGSEAKGPVALYMAQLPFGNS